MMDGVDYIKTKLLFERSTGNLLGGSVLRKDHCTVHNVDYLSLAIQMHATVHDIVAHQYATHPEMAARPSDNMYVFAAQDALKKL
jgi:NADH dehydrogenase